MDLGHPWSVVQSHQALRFINHSPRLGRSEKQLISLASRASRNGSDMQWTAWPMDIFIQGSNLSKSLWKFESSIIWSSTIIRSLIKTCRKQMSLTMAAPLRAASAPLCAAVSSRPIGADRGGPFTWRWYQLVLDLAAEFNTNSREGAFFFTFLWGVPASHGTQIVVNNCNI